jgi:hypothetical protein
MTMNRLEELLPKVLGHWLPYYVLAWVAAVLASAVALDYAWHAFDNSERNDGNSGHATIDFGGQYLMGRMLVTGNGAELYNRFRQHDVLQAVYPAGDGKPGEATDTDNLMYWTMGDLHDAPARSAIASCATPLAAAGPLEAVALLRAGQDAWTAERTANAAHPVGGPLYPPINAFLNAPLALMAPRTAYRVQQFINVLLAFVAAAGARYLARGRVWWPALAAGIMVFPGYAGSINLGQNATLTLTILVWGWALTARGRPVLGGVVWGLLAFKPVWAMAFFLVPFLTRRYRVCVAMVASGAVLALLTLPVVGVHSWFDWLAIGKEAAVLYDMEKNWIFLSRDLLSVPRRWLLDFDKGRDERLDATLRLWPGSDHLITAGLACQLIGWAALLFALECTVRLAVLRRRQAAAPDGPPAAFLFLGAWMCCYHFMYYDVLLGALGLFLLFTEPRRYLAPLLVALAPLRNAVAGPAVVAYHRAAVPDVLPPAVPLELAPRAVWTLNRMAPTAYVLLLATNYLFPGLGLGSHWGPPWDTFCLAGVWAWCGWQWLRHGEKVATSWEDGEPAEPPFDVVPASGVGRNGEADASPAHGAAAHLPGAGAS